MPVAVTAIVFCGSTSYSRAIEFAYGMAAIGRNERVNEKDFPASISVDFVKPFCENGGCASMALRNIFVVPVFVTVIVCDEVEPTRVFGKFTMLGLTVAIAPVVPDFAESGILTEVPSPKLIMKLPLYEIPWAGTNFIPKSACPPGGITLV